MQSRFVKQRTMSITSEGDIASMRHPASFASARTTRVFPVPGGPNNRQPVMLCSFKIPCWKAVGCNNGNDTIVRTESIVCAGRWTCANVVGIETDNILSKEWDGVTVSPLRTYRNLRYTLAVSVHGCPSTGRASLPRQCRPHFSLRHYPDPCLVDPHQLTCLRIAVSTPF